MIELLSPVGNFECLKAAVQNGADAVYFGASSFGARAFAGNFDDEELKKAINYARLRGVKTHLTLNTLIKENEFDDAFNLAIKAYQYGIDAIIVQDLGLALKLINRFPDIEIHASTQMTTHNLDGVLQLQNLGFKRAVLSRELSIDEIKYISQNSNIDLEVFIHGALCISYSGQCLLSSMIGGRSGNRGKCAQPCRLPWTVVPQILWTTTMPKFSGTNGVNGVMPEIPGTDGKYLLSPRDLCGLEFIPELIKAGITSLKIEGRMKSSEYVATVTRIYRKYINLAYDNSKPYIIDENDKQDLLQVFNRGGFSSGHLSNGKNDNLIFEKRQNNMGVYLGKISKYNPSKGIITCNIENSLDLGDSISFEKENTKYTISELMNKNGQNIKTSASNTIVSFGRMKGNIKVGDEIYKINSKELLEQAKLSYSKEYIKKDLICNLKIKSNKKITVEVLCPDFNKKINFTYDYIPEPSQNQPLTQEKIISQFNKTLDTPFSFKTFNIDLDNNLFLPVSVLNEIRRIAIEKIEEIIIQSFKRNYFEKDNTENISAINNTNINKSKTINNTESITTLNTNSKVSLLLNILNKDFDYNLLNHIDKLYIPLKYFDNKEFSDIISTLCTKFNVYIYMPTVLRKKYFEKAKKIIINSLNNFNIKGAVISHISQISLFKDINIDLIGNYTLNIFNSHSISTLNIFNISTTTISPELDEAGILNVLSTSLLPKELIVYGNIPVMTTNYCLLGKSNKCYKNCKHLCLTNSKFYLKDRLGMEFRFIPDNNQTITTIYNSKTTSIQYKNYNINFARIDILDENIDEINKIIDNVKNDFRFEGKDFTNGNLKRGI